MQKSGGRGSKAKDAHPDDALFWKFMDEYSWVFDPQNPGSIHMAFSRAKEHAILMRYSARELASIARRYRYYTGAVRDRMTDNMFPSLGDDSTSDLVNYIVLHGRSTLGQSLVGDPQGEVEKARN